MSEILHRLRFNLSPLDNEHLSNLCGHLEANLRLIEKQFGVEIANRGELFEIKGNENDLQATQVLIEQLYQLAATQIIDKELIHVTAIEQQNIHKTPALPESTSQSSKNGLQTPRGLIKARTSNQQHYIDQIARNDINFGLGPAGTGKTYLAVACAIEALNEHQVRRIILTRPAVEAGENLGFLPGDMAQKIDPYLRPLYDALYDMMGFEKVNRLIEKHVIEIAPLAFMRGRSLNDAYIILDEAQNTSPAQLKMFLTRIGFSSKAIITGDPSQVDLPQKMSSGLQYCSHILKNIKGISFTYFAAEDVVRHPIVQKIVQAYDHYEQQQKDF